MSLYEKNFAVVIPMANEQETFEEFTDSLRSALDALVSGHVYIVIDNASNDNTLALSEQLSKMDERFSTVWAPENKNVVDAYTRGLREAYSKGHEVIIEMDGGLSHDPKEIPNFLKAMSEGNQCVFGSRYTQGGKNVGPPLKRAFLSKSGTILSNLFLGTKLKDMTSGYEAFNRDVVEKIIAYHLISQAHFYQTEIRYLLRYTKYKEIPIVYRSPSDSASRKAITDSLYCLFYYIRLRILGRAASLMP